MAIVLATLSVLASLIIVVYATNTSPIEIDNNMAEISIELNNLQAKVTKCETDKTNAHAMAEAARKLEISENDDIIQTAKEIYNTNHSLAVTLQQEIDTLTQQKSKLEESQTYVGQFKLTGYCACSICCGKWANGITASGAKAVEGITVAADPRVLPLGTRVYIEGIGERVVQDTGGAIKKNKLDIYVSYHSKAFNAIYNQKAAKVWILK